MSKKRRSCKNYLQLNKKKYANSCPGNTTVYTERTREVLSILRHWLATIFLTKWLLISQNVNMGIIYPKISNWEKNMEAFYTVIANLFHILGIILICSSLFGMNKRHCNKYIKLATVVLADVSNVVLIVY